LDKAYGRPTLRARELRANATNAERLLWAHLSARKVAGTRFNRQVPIGPFICDFVSRSAKLIIEVDGGQHDSNVSADEARTRYLEAQGFRVIRFWNNEVLQQIEGVLAEIERALADMPSPNPVWGERRPASFRSCRGHDRPQTREREGGSVAPEPCARS
jgi:very-short-patch-repair endonuclease